MQRLRPAQVSEFLACKILKEQNSDLAVKTTLHEIDFESGAFVRVCARVFAIMAKGLAALAALLGGVAQTEASAPVLFWASFPVLPNETVVIAGAGFPTAQGE